jgi:mRNA interferase MazF
VPYPDDEPKRGEVYFAVLDPVVGSEQAGTRPVLVISLDHDIPKMAVVVTAAITRTLPSAPHPRVPVLPQDHPLPSESAVLTNQIRTLSKLRLRNYVGVVESHDMVRVDQGLALSFGLVSHYRPMGGLS